MYHGTNQYSMPKRIKEIINNEQFNGSPLIITYLHKM